MATMTVRRWVLSAGAVVAAGLLVSAGRPFVLGQQSAGSTLHADAVVVDGHTHVTNRVFWEGIDPWTAQASGTWDYARAKQGGVDIVFEQIWVQDVYTHYNYTVKQALRLVDTFHRVLEANPDRMELALTPADARRIVSDGRMAQVLALEGGFDTEGDPAVLRSFHRLGARLVQFASHDTTNAFADAGRGEKNVWGGINDHGRALVREMNRLGMLISVSHASDAAQLQIVEASAAPVVASHQGLRHFSNYAIQTRGTRTLSDEVLKAVAAKGGLVGIRMGGSDLSQEYWDWARARPSQPQPAVQPLLQPPTGDYGKYIAALDARERAAWRRDNSRPWRDEQQEILDAGGPLPTVEDWLDTVDYAVNLVGEDHVGIGSDLLGGGSVRDFDATSYPRLTEAMLARGYSEARIRKILGENWLRVWDRVVAAGATAERSSTR